MGEKGEVWQWRRRLLAWEEEQVRECSDSLTNIILQSTIYDRWLSVLTMLQVYIITWFWHTLSLLGTRRSLSKSTCLLGICFGIGYQQWTTYQGDTFFSITLNLVWVGAVRWKTLITYSCLLTIFGKYGMTFCIDLA